MIDFKKWASGQFVLFYAVLVKLRVFDSPLLLVWRPLGGHTYPAGLQLGLLLGLRLGLLLALRLGLLLGLRLGLRLGRCYILFFSL